MVKFGNRGKGIACIIASAFGFALMALFVRLCDDYGGEITCFQKSFFRNVLALVIALAVFCRDRRRGPADGELQASTVRKLFLQVLRAENRNKEIPRSKLFLVAKGTANKSHCPQCH